LLLLLTDQQLVGEIPLSPPRQVAQQPRSRMPLSLYSSSNIETRDPSSSSYATNANTKQRATRVSIQQAQHEPDEFRQDNDNDSYEHYDDYDNYDDGNMIATQQQQQQQQQQQDLDHSWLYQSQPNRQMPHGQQACQKSRSTSTSTSTNSDRFHKYFDQHQPRSSISSHKRSSTAARPLASTPSINGANRQSRPSTSATPRRSLTIPKSPNLSTARYFVLLGTCDCHAA
jgi:hypothetical protein